MALHTFVWLYFFNLLPSISRCVALPARHLLELMDRSIRFAAWSGLFAIGVLSALAPMILTMIYGPAFRAATSSFSVLAWMLPVAMLSGHHRFILIGYGHQKMLLTCTAASAVAAVALGFLLVPLYGGVGAAWALLIANVVNFALVYFAVRSLVARISVVRQLGAPLAAFCFSCAAYYSLVGWNPWVALAVALVFYVSCLVWTDGRDLGAFLLSVVRKPIPSEA
jgi:O-antigen/teichoic acid export membrane protein